MGQFDKRRARGDYRTERGPGSPAGQPAGVVDALDLRGRFRMIMIAADSSGV